MTAAVVVTAARAAHEANRAYCESLGDFSQDPWFTAPNWQRSSCIKGVEAILADPSTTPEQSHKGWCIEKVSNGWVYGETKDAEAKTHPCMVPYDELPAAQRVKDALFGAVVRAVLDPELSHYKLNESALRPGVRELVGFFAYEHLPMHLQTASRPVGELARRMAAEIYSCAELTVGLRKLLEAKDCFVRALVQGAAGSTEPTRGTPTAQTGQG